MANTLLFMITSAACMHHSAFPLLLLLQGLWRGRFDRRGLGGVGVGDEFSGFIEPNEGTSSALAPGTTGTFASGVGWCGSIRCLVALWLFRLNGHGTGRALPAPPGGSTARAEGPRARNRDIEGPWVS